MDLVSSPLPPFVPDHELLRCIGRGSYGEVWLARNVMGMWRAVKVVQRGTFDSDRPYEREFAGIQRYEPLSRSSEGLVQVLHVGRNDAAGYFYYVMELADAAAAEAGGPSSAGPAWDAASYSPRTLRSGRSPLQRLPVAECADLARSLATGLAYLHQHGLLHRDLKPSNVIFVNGHAKLADLGLVTGFGAGRTFVGTEGYVPPEGPGAPSADLYALGRVLYEAATGHEPGRFPEIPADWIDASNATALLEFHEIVLRLGEGRAAHRYQRAEEVLADLALLQSGKSMREFRTLRRRIVWLRGLGAVALAAFMVAGLGLALVNRRAADVRRNFERVDGAEKAARRELVNAYLAQARAQRFAGGLGERDSVLAALTNAARLVPTAEQRHRLRAEAAAALALTDTRFVPAPEALRHHDAMGVICDAAQLRFARLEDDGVVSVGWIADGVITRRLPALATLPDQVVGFSPGGHFLNVRCGDEFFIGDLDAGRYCRTNGVCTFTAQDHLVTAGLGGQPVEVTLPGGEARSELPAAPEAARVPKWSVFAMAPRGRRLAGSAEGERRVLLWDTEASLLSEVLAVSDDVRALAWSGDGQQLAAGTATGDLVVWRLPDTGPRRTFHAHGSAVRQLAFTADGRWLASASEDETLKLFDVGAGREIARTDAIAWSLSFGPDDRWLALVWRGGTPGFLRLEPPLGFTLWHGSKTDAGDGAVAFSRDGRWLASANASSVELWDVAHGVVTASYPAHLTHALVFNEHSSALWLLDTRGVQRWETRIEIEPTFGVGAGALAQIVGRPGRNLAASADAMTLALADPTTETVTIFRGPNESVVLQPHEFVRFVGLSAEGSFAASGSWSVPNVKLWDTRSGALLATLPSGLNVRPAFSPDGHWLAAVGPTCSLWHLADRRSGPEMPATPRNTVGGAVVFSPDSSLLATVLGDHEVHLFRLPEAAPWLILEAPGGARLLALAFSPDGRMLAATTVQGEVQLWRLVELDQALTALGLRAEIKSR